MTDSDFAFVAKLVFDRSAIVLEPGKEYLVESRLTPVARQHGCDSLDEFVKKMRAGGAGDLQGEVVEAMVTTETLFFRDVHPFETLRSTVLPRLIAARQTERRLAIWCAASSSGQEPYTIALILKEYFPQLSGWRIEFLATDISHQMIGRSREGRYSQMEVNRGLPADLRLKYFRENAGYWHIRDDLRAMIDFRQINLAAPWPSLPAFDLIFLRNVMIYFDVGTKKSILSRVARLLRPDGYRVLGGAETTMNLDNSYQRVADLKSGYFCLVAK